MPKLTSIVEFEVDSVKYIVGKASDLKKNVSLTKGKKMKVITLPATLASLMALNTVQESSTVTLEDLFGPAWKFIKIVLAGSTALGSAMLAWKEWNDSQNISDTLKPIIGGVTVIVMIYVVPDILFKHGKDIDVPTIIENL